MRNLVGGLSLLALARLGAAQSECLSLTSKFPSCAFACVSKAASQVGCTNTQDLACQCSSDSSMAILATAQGCVLACGDDELLPAFGAGERICTCVAAATATAESTASASPPSTAESTPSASLPSSNTPQLPTSMSQWLNSSSETPLTTAAASSSGATTPSPSSSASGSSDSAGSESSSSEEKPSQGGETSASGASTHSSGDTGITETTSTETECLSPSPVLTSSCVPGAKADCGPVASSAIPACAQPCFSSAAPVVSCTVDDYACQRQAQTRPRLGKLLLPCVASACESSAFQSIIAGASSVCQCASANPTDDSGPQPTTTAESSSQAGGQIECTTGSCKEQSAGQPKPPQPECNHESCKEQPTGQPDCTHESCKQPIGQPKPPQSTDSQECTHDSCKEKPTGQPKPPQPECTHESCKQPTGQPKPPQPECTHDSCKEQPTGGQTGSPQPPKQPPTGKPEESKSRPTQPTGRPTAPPVAAASSGRFEMSLVACVFTAFWMIAVAL